MRVRPGFKVEARSEYSLAEQRPPGGPRADRLAQAGSEVLPARDVSLAVSAVPMIAGSRLAAVLVARVAAGSLRPTSMLAGALTPRAAPVVSRRIAIPAPSGGDRDSTALGLVSALALEPGSYEIRLGTELPGGGAGSVHTFVEIPDFRRAPLSLSGVLLHAAPEEPAVPRAEIDDVLPFVPTARRVFGGTDEVSAFVQVSQGTTRKDTLQPVSLRLRVDDVHDATVRTETGALPSERFAKNRTANARFALPVRGLPPGHYLLTLEAAMGEARAARALRFEMR